MPEPLKIPSVRVRRRRASDRRRIYPAVETVDLPELVKRRCIRLVRLIELDAPDVLLANERQLVRNAVDELLARSEERR